MGEFEGVIKCVKVPREGESEDRQHPSLPVLAMKAWLGLRRYAEAEKELRGMVVNKGVPEGVWESAVEDYFQAAGTAGGETAKEVFLGLLGRCRVSAGAAVRVAHRVAGSGGGDGWNVWSKVVAELASDQRVMALFSGEAAVKQRTAMHAVLWNCAADHFRSKDYETSAEMFEKAMLYIPYDVESRTLRGKGFRVLCHLGLSRLNQALEYINEAEKLEPTVASAFLKLLKSIPTGTQLNDDQVNSFETDLFFVYTICALDNPGSQLLVVKSFGSSTACNPKYLLEIGLNASQGPQANQEVAYFALNESLESALVSSAGVPERGSHSPRADRHSDSKRDQPKKKEEKMGEEVCSWDGTISAHEFYASAHVFEERWKRSNPNLPPWKWVSSTTQNLGGRVLHSHNQFNGFLTLEKLCLFELTRREMPFLESLNEVKAQETRLFEEDEPIDNATLVGVSNPGVGIHYYDFHILYSAPFRVPVLFFRAYQTDGQTLTLDEIEKQLPSSSSKILVESKWTFITQEEHPELKRPWYKLHPCGTSEWMKLLFKSDSSLSNHKSEPIQELYLFSWLSVVGQVVGLRIPLEIMNHHLEIMNH